MNREELFEEIGELDEELLLQSEAPKKLGGLTWKRWAYIAACIAVIAVMAISYQIISNKGSSYTADSQQEGTSSDNQAGNSIENEEFVSVQYLLRTFEEGQESKLIEDQDDGLLQEGLLQETKKYITNTGDTQEESLLTGRDIPVGKHKAVYREVESAGREILWRSLGRPIAGSDCFYYVSGHKDMQYLISLKDDELSLWEFGYFQDEEYPYSDVLELVYDIHSADDIEKVLSKPADIDNSDQGKALQEEIGNLEITDREDIETLYQILTSLTCLGGDEHWELKVNLGDDLNHGGINAVWRGRYLSITTAWGNVINTMKYTAFSNMFYEYDGIVYKKLSEQQANDLERILQISSEPAPRLEHE